MIFVTRTFLCYASPLLWLAAWITLALSPQRSLGLYLGCLSAAWLGFWGTWRSTVFLSGKSPVVWLWSGAIAARLIGWLAAPVFENDWARFLWDGWLTCQGKDPWQSVPMDWFTEASVPETMRGVLDQINHPGLHTVYGPAAQAGFALAAWIAPGSLLVLKAVFLAADCAIIALLQRAAGAQRAILYAWCPLVIQETSFSAHPDVMAIALMLAAWLGQRNRVASGFCLALALACRPQALLLAPFLLWRTGWRGGLGLLSGLIICYAPCVWLGHWAEWSTLSQMAGDWRFNDILRSGFALVMEEPAVRWTSQLLFAIGAGLVFAHWWRQKAVPLPALGFLYGWWWLCSPVANAWYLQFAVPFLVLSTAAAQSIWSRAGQRLTWALLLTAPLTYVTGLQIQNGSSAWELAPWVMPVEAAVCLGAVLTTKWHRLSSFQHNDTMI